MLKDLQMTDDQFYKMEQLFKVFGDYTRLKIIKVLNETSKICVIHLAERLSMSHSSISHQLRVLRQNNLVKHVKEGKNVFYSLSDEHVRDIFKIGLEHINE